MRLQWKSLLDKLPSGIAVINSDGYIVYSNALLSEFSTKEYCSIRPKKRKLKVNEYFDQSLIFKDGKSLTEILSDENNMGPNIGDLLGANGEKAKIIEVEWFPMKFDSMDCKVLKLKNVSEREELHKQVVEQKYLKLLLASVTHDLRTPLNGISGMLELIEQEPLSEAGNKYLQVARNTTNLALYLVNDLLDFSQIEAHSFKLAYENVEISKVIEECKLLYENEYTKKGLYLTSEYDSSVPASISIDKSRYKQILLNLISNAYKFTPVGGVKIYVRFDESQNLLITAVEDSGVGLKPENISNLFKLYTKLDDHNSLNPKGVGLGLTICKKIVEQHGGTITVESEYGKGTIFEFSVKCKDVQSTYTETDKNQTIRLIQKSPHPKKVRALRNQVCLSENLKSDTNRVIQQIPDNCAYGKILVVDDTDTNLLILQAFCKASGISMDAVFLYFILNKGKKRTRSHRKNTHSSYPM